MDFQWFLDYDVDELLDLVDKPNGRRLLHYPV